MSDCSRSAWMRPGMPPTTWRELPVLGGEVNVPAADEPHMIDVTTRMGERKHFPMALREGDAPAEIRFDGEPWPPRAKVDWEDRCDID